MSKNGSQKGIIITEGKTLELRIPRRLIKIFEGEPRLIFKKLEWYGIHPIDPKMLTGELQELAKDYEFIAVPKQMMK